jgi:phosphatidylserine/phosphatidylglycerophosphate/cardiolipin synthase-like enzyme
MAMVRPSNHTLQSLLTREITDFFWAVSELLERATESIFIFDWWLSPEIFLRRPPSQYPQYRLDRLLAKKAEQGVKVHVIVYKEVSSWDPNLYPNERLLTCENLRFPKPCR